MPAAIAQIAKPEQLDVKDAEQTTFTEPHNVIPTAEVHPSAKDKESPPVHESEPQVQPKEQRGMSPSTFSILFHSCWLFSFMTRKPPRWKSSKQWVASQVFDM